MPNVIETAHNTWINKNPDYCIQLFDDDECLQFVIDNFDNRVIDAYKKMPLAVMRADFWRYLVVFKSGGGYSDIDTICNSPISDWMPKDAKLVICKEKAFYFLQWTFYSEANHPILKNAIELICQRALDEGIDLTYKPKNSIHDTFVHYYTGPLLWTDAIIQYVNEQVDVIIKMVSDLTPAHLQALAGQGIYIFEERLFNGDKSKHLCASLNYFSEEYCSWRGEVSQLIGWSTSWKDRLIRHWILIWHWIKRNISAK